MKWLEIALIAVESPQLRGEPARFLGRMRVENLTGFCAMNEDLQRKAGDVLIEKKKSPLRQQMKISDLHFIFLAVGAGKKLTLPHVVES
jgi:hypothetical protein